MTATGSTDPTTIVMVVGAHRTGTSAITRMLPVLGVELGDRLMAANLRNARGYWEDLDIKELNDAMLGFIDKPWYNVSPVTQADVARLVEAGFARIALAALREKVADHAVFGLKDPRSTKLLGFWVEVLRRPEFDPRFVIALRDPVSATASLASRNGFTHEHGSRLWLAQMVAALHHTRGHSRIVVDFDRVLDNPEQQARRLAAGLDLPIIESRLQAYTHDFLDRDLASHRDRQELAATDHGGSVPWCEVHAVLAAAAAQPGSGDAAVLDVVANEWSASIDDNQQELAQFDRSLGAISVRPEQLTPAMWLQRRARSLWAFLRYGPRRKRTLVRRMLGEIGVDPATLHGP